MKQAEINKRKRQISIELRNLFNDTMQLISRYGLSAEEKAENERKIQANDKRSEQLWKEINEVGRNV